MIRSPSRLLLYVLEKCVLAVLCLAVGGCGSSGSNNSVPDVEIDNSAPVGTPQSGILDDDVAPGMVSFLIGEDSILDAYFFAPAQGNDNIFTIMSLPQSGTITLLSEGTVFRYKPDSDYFGADSFIYSTSDGSQITVSIDITPIPDPPVLEKNVTTVANQGRLYSYILKATDADGDQLRFSGENLPEWLTLDALNGVLSGVPRQTDIGLTPMMVLSVTDPTGRSDSIDSVQLNVIDVNDAPRLNITQVPRELYGNETSTFNVYPDDEDNDGVNISVEPHPAFDATVERGRITLQMRDINRARPSELVIVGRDDRGAVTREPVPVFLYPRTVSGRGTTISGVKQGRGVHIVILGDGYAVDQQGAFRRHVDGVLDYIRSDEGIAAHLGAFNIHMIETVSEESGADDSDTRDAVSTAYDSAYNCRAIARLVCANTLKLFEAALGEYPGSNQIILLVNDIRFGGSGSSGGRVAITSAFHPEIALHEMGHSLADLADEYVDPQILESTGAPPFEEGRYSNVSLFSDPLKVPWKHWLDLSVPLPQSAYQSGVGVFEGGLYQSTGVYRATFTSRMREYDKPFGPVNTEQWVLRLYTLTDGYRLLEPMVRSLQAVAGETLNFNIEPVFGPDVQKITWTLNGEELSAIDAGLLQAGINAAADTAVDPYQALPKTVPLQGGGAVAALTNVKLTAIDLSLPAGQHVLALRLSDISGRIQVSPPHAGIFNWVWSINVQ